MSYSFNIRADTRDEAKQAVVERLDLVAQEQPLHQADSAAAYAAACALINLMEQPGLVQEISVSVSGSVCKFKGEAQFTSASLSVHAAVLDKAGS